MHYNIGTDVHRLLEGNILSDDEYSYGRTILDIVIPVRKCVISSGL